MMTMTDEVVVEETVTEVEEETVTDEETVVETEVTETVTDEVTETVTDDADSVEFTGAAVQGAAVGGFVGAVAALAAAVAL